MMNWGCIVQIETKLQEKHLGVRKKLGFTGMIGVRYDLRSRDGASGVLSFTKQSKGLGMKTRIGGY